MRDEKSITAQELTLNLDTSNIILDTSFRQSTGDIQFFNKLFITNNTQGKLFFKKSTENYKTIEVYLTQIYDKESNVWSVDFNDNWKENDFGYYELKSNFTDTFFIPVFWDIGDSIKIDIPYSSDITFKNVKNFEASIYLNNE